MPARAPVATQRAVRTSGRGAGLRRLAGDGWSGSTAPGDGSSRSRYRTRGRSRCRAWASQTLPEPGVPGFSHPATGVRLRLAPVLGHVAVGTLLSLIERVELGPDLETYFNEVLHEILDCFEACFALRHKEEVAERALNLGSADISSPSHDAAGGVVVDRDHHRGGVLTEGGACAICRRG